MELVVIGGGCYGTDHTRQLLKAARTGHIAPRRNEGDPFGEEWPPFPMAMGS